jgi:hypothetical protein
LQNELLTGTTQQVIDPSVGATRILVGESQVKMDRLWAETLWQIEALQARPIAERDQTVAMLSQISGADPVYLSRSRTPYNPASELEEYEAGAFMYQVDIKSGQIVKVWLKNQEDYRVDALYSEAELADMARDYIANVYPEISLDRLTLIVQNKDKEVYFFRWEDPASQTADGTQRFVQVAYSQSGDFLNYENTFPFSLPSTNNLLDQILTVRIALAIGANEIYSNGGTRWDWEIQSSYSTKSNAGYCYGQGSWCTPKNFYYTSSPSGNNTYNGTNHRGKWTATSYMRSRNTRTSAYIPCTNATASVFYYNWYNGGASHTENGVNQQSWCNTWVNTSSTLYDIQRIVLANTSETCCSKEIAWDETWDYVP